MVQRGGYFRQPDTGRGFPMDGAQKMREARPVVQILVGIYSDQPGDSRPVQDIDRGLEAQFYLSLRLSESLEEWEKRNKIVGTSRATLTVLLLGSTSSKHPREGCPGICGRHSGYGLLYSLSCESRFWEKGKGNTHMQDFSLKVKSKSME